MIVSISQGSSWHWLPIKRKSPDKEWLDFEHCTGEWSLYAYEAFENHLYKILEYKRLLFLGNKAKKVEARLLPH